MSAEKGATLTSAVDVQRLVSEKVRPEKGNPEQYRDEILALQLRRHTYVLVTTKLINPGNSPSFRLHV